MKQCIIICASSRDEAARACTRVSPDASLLRDSRACLRERKSARDVRSEEMMLGARGAERAPAVSELPRAFASRSLDPRNRRASSACSASSRDDAARVCTRVSADASLLRDCRARVRECESAGDVHSGEMMLGARGAERASAASELPRAFASRSFALETSLGAPRHAP
jgi:hypothetical protein